MNERETAVYTLIDILNEKAYNNIVLRRTLNNNKQLSAIQRAFITELVNGTLRNINYIDFVLSHFSKTPLNKMKPFILNILRISVYQIVFMKKIPDSAACNEAVKIVKKKGFGTLSGFVNGVLRNVSRKIDSVVFPDSEKNPVQYLSVMYSYPEWLIEYWLNDFEFQTVSEMCKSNNNFPVISVCANLIKTDLINLKYCFEEDNIAVANGRITKNSLCISRTSDIREASAFKNGLFHIMDESAMLAVDILDPHENETIIDVCAAPGGKSFYSAYLMKNKGKIFSRDIYEHKISLIDDSCKRLGIDIIEAQTKDASVKYDDDYKIADRVIVDAPCSGFGLARKKPDIKYNKTYDDIIQLSELQKSILAASSEYVKDGGILVYSTCTVSSKENIENVNWFLKNYPFELDDISPFVNESVNSDTLSSGYIQIMPNDYNTDGFFIARFKRKG